MSDQIIRKILESRLQTYADANNYFVAFENVPFDPVDVTHLEAFVLPASTTAESVDGANTAFRGVFQVSIVFPQGEGSAEATAIAADLRALFPATSAGRFIDSGITLVVTSPLAIGPLLQRGTMAVLPTSFRYRCDA